jgi:flavin-dependent dehydrogenase
MHDYDVAIVGASIAGCTAATLLARQGAKVALLESHRDPAAYKRTCTHFIQASGIPTLERLGVLGRIQDAGARSSELNMWTRFGWISTTREHGISPAADYVGWNVRRETLDPMLRALAAETPGVELLLGHTVTGLLREGERVRGVIARERDSREQRLHARFVLAADGRESPVGKLAGVPAKLKGHGRFGYFAYYRDTPLVTGSEAQMWLLDPDVAYAFPTDGDLTLITAMPHMDRLPEFRPDPEAALARLFETLPEAPRVDPTKRVSKVMGKLEIPNVTRPPARPGLAFVGDSALGADPLWGVGCGFALQSAEWLAEAVAPALRGSEPELDGALKRYARRHRKGLKAHERFCASYSSGRPFNPFERLLFRAAARDQVVADRMGIMGSRWITPQQMLTPATFARILRVNLRAPSPIGLRAPRTPRARVAG